jgi:hypothetical protein
MLAVIARPFGRSKPEPHATLAEQYSKKKAFFSEEKKQRLSWRCRGSLPTRTIKKQNFLGSFFKKELLAFL